MSKTGISFSKKDPIIISLRELLQSYMELARANELGIKVDNDPEYLHQYRVNLRKLRSLVTTCKGVLNKDATNEIRQLVAETMSYTNYLRDLDVFLSQKSMYQKLIDKSFLEEFNVLFAHIEGERNESFQNVIELLSNDHYNECIHRLKIMFSAETFLSEAGKYADCTSKAFVRDLIWKRYRKIYTRAESVEFSTDDEIHKVRIMCKKLRYVIESFEAFFPDKKTKVCQRVLKRLQNDLGSFNDCSVQQKLLEAFSCETPEVVALLKYALKSKQDKERNGVVKAVASFVDDDIKAAFHSLCRGGMS